MVSAPAHGRPGTTVVIAVYVGPHAGWIRPIGEIAEVAWIIQTERNECAGAIQLVIDQAVADGLLKSQARSSGSGRRHRGTGC